MENLLRYTLIERVVHWISAIAYTYALATGAAFWSPHLYWIAILLGGAPTSRFWHPWVSLVFVAAMVWMLSAWLADMRITACDRAWGGAIQHYIRNEDEDLPPVDRFNLGQKYFFWVMAASGMVLLLSGALLWVPELIPWTWRGLRYAAILLHAAAALVTTGAFIIHVYMGTAVVRGGYTSIIRGQVSPAWARTHHRLWYNRVTGNRITGR